MTHTDCQLFTSVVWFFLLLERTSNPGFDKKKKKKKLVSDYGCAFYLNSSNF
jgi:hypothetical protein